MNALNWPALIAEALRRRKAERMTQKEHAALADVSIPTIVAFDKGERTLSLNKAFDILRVVGLVKEPVPEDAQDVFVREAFERWRTLTAGLPANSPGRFPHGWYRIDYELEGELNDVKPRELATMLGEAVVHHTGWPMFRISQRPDLAPYETDSTTECWLPPGDHIVSRALSDAAHSDFWRAAPAGRMFLMRGYAEDSQDTIPPGAIFDTILPIWRLGEALLHACRLASLLTQGRGGVTVHLRVLFTGLTGRTMRSWSNPLGSDFLLGGHSSRSDEALLEASVPAADIDTDLASHVLALAAPLYERFGVAGLSHEGVHAELTRMRQNRFA